MDLLMRWRPQYGIMLPYEVKERYGSELLYPAHSPRAGEQMYPDREVTGTVIERGEVFIDWSVLEELQEADHSYGMGGAYLVNGWHEGLALELAGLATQETRGGYYTTPEQKDRLVKLVEELYSQYKELSKTEYVHTPVDDVT